MINYVGFHWLKYVMLSVCVWRAIPCHDVGFQEVVILCGSYSLYTPCTPCLSILLHSFVTRTVVVPVDSWLMTPSTLPSWMCPSLLCYDQLDSDPYINIINLHYDTNLYVIYFNNNQNYNTYSLEAILNNIKSSTL